MHSPKKKKKSSLAIHTKLSMCMCLRIQSLSADGLGTVEEKKGSKGLFTQCRGLTP
ncbi:unnamed protein product [Staurois parvus]|uniref:Uncharacterized protein n=1 Tax=Staurois parvus TaxID=386267 RepID=A0ABN9G3B2_9NEOB|nr:unnamed protein product [Staurois parvus]